MHSLIVWVRRLRRILLFKVSMRSLVIILMLAGAYVATRTFDVDEVFDINDKVKHLVVFFGFAFLMDLATSRHPFWLWKGLPLLIYGLLIEIMQYYSPERSFSLFDWLADFLGILLYFIVKQIFVWLDYKKVTNT